MFGVEQCPARLFTWELSSNFDEAVSLAAARCAFEREFPAACERLREGGGSFCLWPLVSFNATEGRLSRYLVAFTERRACKGRRRPLPPQIWLYSAADGAAMEIPPDECSGSFWCHAQVEDSLYIVVFFEGRLCHWAEEVLPACDSEYLDLRLERFRRFLKKDPLFSRAPLKELALDGGSFETDARRRLFRRASRDPYFRSLSLLQDTGKRKKTGTRALFVLGILLLVLLGLFPVPATDSCESCNDPPPVPLLPAPQVFEVAEPVTAHSSEPFYKTVPAGFPEKFSRATTDCALPDFHLKGVVSNKLAMVSESENTRTLAPGDSLGTFALRRVGRDRIELVCKDSLVEWLVEW